jgi:DNA-binding MarR family transcriptional regulator
MANNLDLEVLKKFRILIQEAQNHSNRIKKKTGISGAQLWVLKVVTEQTHPTIGEIAKEMVMSQSTVSNLVEQLTSIGYVTRETSPRDRRKVFVHITTKGVKLLEKAPEPHQGLLPYLLAQTTRNNLLVIDQSLENLLTMISKVHSKYAEEPLPFTI